MYRRVFELTALLASLSVTPFASAQRGVFPGDAYTAYHLLEPGSDSFRIIFYPSETRAGSRILINGTRPGSKGKDVEVYDPRTGEPMKFEYLDGAELLADKTPGRFTAGEHYIRAQLSRPVPQGGEGRVRIEKTYVDKRSYFTEGEELVFQRGLGVGRQSVVLPRGYALVSCNVASQLISLPDGRLQVSFANINNYRAEVELRARKTSSPMGSKVTLGERAFDRTKTLYDLREPSLGRVHVTLDYIETTPGERSHVPYFGKELAEATAIDLDTAESLTVSESDGGLSLQLARPIESEKQSAHLKVSGILRDGSYRLDGDELVFERELGGVRNAVLLPAGWEPTIATSPVTVGTHPENGRMLVRLVNGRPEEGVSLTLRARKGKGSATQ